MYACVLYIYCMYKAPLIIIIIFIGGREKQRKYRMNNNKYSDTSFKSYVSFLFLNSLMKTWILSCWYDISFF
ncbi:hypothetical protein GLOIN_2v1636319, partial [Rhizophagus irregularis DAOM 181602=DAOM 197198]